MILVFRDKQWSYFIGYLREFWWVIWLHAVFHYMLTFKPSSLDKIHYTSNDILRLGGNLFYKKYSRIISGLSQWWLPPSCWCDFWISVLLRCTWQQSGKNLSFGKYIVATYLMCFLNGREKARQGVSAPELRFACFDGPPVLGMKWWLCFTALFCKNSVVFNVCTLMGEWCIRQNYLHILEVASQGRGVMVENHWSWERAKALASGKCSPPHFFILGGGSPLKRLF